MASVPNAPLTSPHPTPLLWRQAVVTKAGPTFVKLAQTLAMRPDLIGETYAATLAELQDNVAPFGTPHAMAIVERELGRPLGEVFSYISPAPIASASLGQVSGSVGVCARMCGGARATHLSRPRQPCTPPTSPPHTH